MVFKEIISSKTGRFGMRKVKSKIREIKKKNKSKNRVTFIMTYYSLATVSPGKISISLI